MLPIAAVAAILGHVHVARADGKEAEPLAPRVTVPSAVVIAAETPSPSTASTSSHSADFDAFVGRVLAPSLSMQSLSIQPRMYGWFSGFGLNVRGTL